MRPEDVALSRGEALAPVDPKRVVRDPLGRPIAVWAGKLDQERSSMDRKRSTPKSR